MPIRIDDVACAPGLTFMTMHFQDDVATNLLTIDATDPKSGTAEFKATAIRIERLGSEPIDLKIVGPNATEAERDAIDAVVADGARRDLVLPALHAVQARIGWIGQGALNHISRRLTVPPRSCGGRHLLSSAVHEAAPADRRACMRRHRVPHPRR